MRTHTSGVHKLAVSIIAVFSSSCMLPGGLPASAVPERAKSGPDHQSAPAAQSLGKPPCCSAAFHCHAKCEGESFTAGSGTPLLCPAAAHCTGKLCPFIDAITYL